MTRHVEHADSASDSGLRSLAKQAGPAYEDVIQMAERRQLHLAIARANSSEGQARRHAECRRREQRDRGLLPGGGYKVTTIENTIASRSTLTGRQVLAQTMAMWQPTG